MKSGDFKEIEYFMMNNFVSMVEEAFHVKLDVSYGSQMTLASLVEDNSMFDVFYLLIERE